MEPSRTRLVAYRGVSIVELIVVLAIIGILTVVTVISQGSFNKTLILANTAYDVALSIRSAQTFGLGNRLSGTPSNAGYGVRFTSTPDNEYTIFIDTDTPPSTCHPASVGTAPDMTPGNCRYNVGDSLLQTITLGNGITIKDFCTYQGSQAYCKSASGLSGGIVHTPGLVWLDVVFSRPNTKSFFSVSPLGYNAANTSACITLTSPQGGLRYVSVEQTGQISASSTPCP